MISKEESDLLTQTGPGTPCGELMRRYWQPAALSEELPVGGPPLPVKLLGQELVLFRDKGGHPGLLDLHCPHRGADLSYGRLEDGGVRCIYHGWLFDAQGRCLDMPGEPDGGAKHKDSIRLKSYPCRKQAGAIFAYLGPGKPPLFPNYEFLVVPEDRAFAIKLFHECNYLQGNEANIDLNHLSFLHYNFRNREDGEASAGEELDRRGAAPEMESYDAELTDYGVRSYKSRRYNGRDSYRLFMTEFVLPNFTAFFGGQYAVDGTYSVNWHVPVDDTHHWKYTFIFSRNGPIDKEATRRQRAEMMPDYKPVRTKANRYMQERESMKKESYSGIGLNFQIQDMCVTEGMGAIQNRMEECLASLDIGVIAARKVLIKAMRDLQEGREPRNVVRDPKLNRFSIDACADLIPNSQPWRDYIREKKAGGSSAPVKTA